MVIQHKLLGNKHVSLYDGPMHKRPLEKRPVETVTAMPMPAARAAGDRAAATAQISCYVRQFDFVNVQEDFNYHAALYDRCDDHPYRSPTSGGAAFGSGHNSLSRFTCADWERIRWNACNGVDCLTPRGFTLARVRLAEGVCVGIYNARTQADTTGPALDARRRNLSQLLGYIEWASAGNAVIVMGDTNKRYTRGGDNIREFLSHGFKDVWLDRLRNGDVPASGAPDLACGPAVTGRDCEVVDKVLVRYNGFVGLSAADYRIAVDAVGADGVDLSDHRGVAVDWRYSTAANRRLSDQFGGPHGDSFNDVSLLPAEPAVRELKIRTGRRVDRVETVLANGYPYGHGGWGVDEHSLSLGNGEVFDSVRLCSGKHDNGTRIFRAEFHTSAGRSLSGGSPTADCVTYAAPAGWQIVAFHGRANQRWKMVR